MNIYILILFILHSSFKGNKASSETVEVEISSSGEIQNDPIYIDRDVSETGPPSDPPEPIKDDSETGPPSDAPLVYRRVEKPGSNQFWVTFINSSPKVVHLVWDDGGREGILQATIEPNGSARIGTFCGHVFYFRYPNQMKREYTSYMKHGLTQVIFKDAQTRQQDAITFQKEKRLFIENYLNRTGRKWEAYYPRDKPVHYMYPGDFIGQKHRITSNHSYYTCYPVTESVEDVKKCRDDEHLLQFEWEIVSTSPRAMWLSPPFLSDFEIKHIQMLAEPELKESTVGHGSGAYASKVRTSKGCFIDREITDVVDWIFRRIADVTQIEESFLWHMIGSENLQVLKYEETQQFKPHNDYNTNREQMRFLTFLMYLNTLEEEQGGKTTFPLANISVIPKKGNVVAFYSILEDGNADYMSLHASTPLKYGTKWSAPIWIWDPNQS